MTQIDQFESVFRAAEKTPFKLDPVAIKSALLIVDQPETELNDYAGVVTNYIGDALDGPCEVLPASGSQSVSHLLNEIDNRKPDLLITYRNLHMPADEHPYSLGMHLEVVTQATTIPVLLMPDPQTVKNQPDLFRPIQSVIVATDHLAGDHRLISYAIHFTPPDGNLVLGHIEDSSIFERYIAAIEKIPAIDTDTARQEILARLLKDPEDYAKSCQKVLQNAGIATTVESEVRLGHLLSDYRQLITEHRVDLIVLNTKDDDQLAMHGLAYPLAVELRELPMLLL